MSQVKKIRVWDRGVRLFHWSLVLLFVLSYITGEELENVHAWSGYGIIALLLFRFLWGFVGTKYARFADFIYAPVEVVVYLKSLVNGSPKHYLGHNPAGGLMVLVMLVSLAMTCWSGLNAYAEEGHGPLASVQVELIADAYADDDEDEHEHEGEGEEFWEEIHEFFVNFTLLLVVIHIVGVYVSGLLHGENLVRAMLTGDKEKDA